MGIKVVSDKHETSAKFQYLAALVGRHRFKTPNESKQRLISFLTQQ